MLIFKHTETGRIVKVENSILIQEYQSNPDFERISAVDELSLTYGWPLKIKESGYVAYLHSAQLLNDGEKPIPCYRFPGGVRCVFGELTPA
jgi:hypothetical protein